MRCTVVVYNTKDEEIFRKVYDGGLDSFMNEEYRNYAHLKWVWWKS